MFPLGKSILGVPVILKRDGKSHITELNGGYHHNEYLQYAWEKYGEESFTFGIIQPVINSDNLYPIEENWIKIKGAARRDIGYNIDEICGPNHFLGKKHTAESRAKMSASLKGKRVGEANPFYGRKHSLEVQQQITEKIKGQKWSEEQKTNLKEVRKCVDYGEIAKRSWETRRLKGNATQTPESRKKAWETRRKNHGDDNQLGKPIGAFDDNDNLVMQFKSGKEAYRAGYTTADWSQRTGKKGKGYYWRYLKDENDVTGSC